ncbi:carbohydrate ABC transporter permease [Labrys okinawensis]|uniref:carbohydrate ABC transporter permease n=1 Tax=Labrys okinawensis TaxID=346911 RepID=UPI0039BD9323
MNANAENLKLSQPQRPTLRRRRTWLRMKNRLDPYLYILPASVLICILMLVPIATVIRYSFEIGSIVTKQPSFAGLTNYANLIQDSLFWQAAGHTLYFTLMSVVFHLLLGLAFALLLNSDRIDPTIRSIFRILYILPWLFTAVIVAVVWRLMLEPEGIVNSLLSAAHLISTKIEWFSSTNTAIHALTFVNIWAGYPLYMVTILAALQGIPKELYEAGEVDGANVFAKFLHITIPQIRPVVTNIALLDLIWTSQVFPLIWMTTGGGPIFSTEMLSTYTYKLAFTRYQFSLASASAITILLISVSITYFYIKHQKLR